jgi:hypothetical protein
MLTHPFDLARSEIVMNVFIALRGEIAGCERAERLKKKVIYFISTLVCKLRTFGGNE